MAKSMEVAAKPAAKGGRGGRRVPVKLDPKAVIKSTEKAANAALLIQERCNACHGQTVRDVLGSMIVPGMRYRMADLRYDIQHGRLELLDPGSSVGQLPKGKARADAPLAGQPMPPASLDEFFRFLQGQLRFETQHHTGTEVSLEDREAEAMFPDVQAFATPNLGATERYVPYHTVLGVHELFLVEHVHHRDDWDEHQKFLAVFVFRAHCKRDLFLKAQLPLMLSQKFWQNPAKAFENGGPMEQSILAYRKETGEPLLTNCFRIIPARVLKDDTANLVRSIVSRTVHLLQVADQAWSVLKDPKRKPAEKVTAMSELILKAPGLGETWAKMLTVCIDLAYPKEHLLESQCDVGIGAAAPLRCLLPKGGPTDRKEALIALLKILNSSKTTSANHFWNKLKEVEQVLRKKFKALKLICAQANTKPNAMTAVTLQVQLCEYRQFRHSVARNKYGLPDDETMRGEVEKENRLHADDFIEFDKTRNCVHFEFPTEDGSKIPFEVPVKATGGSQRVARRVAALCFQKLRVNATKAEALQFRDELLDGYSAGEDVPDDSPAWEECRAQITHVNPPVAFNCVGKDGQRIHFQTTVIAAGGVLHAERIARLCYAKLVGGAKKDAVLQYRDGLYLKVQQNGSSGSPAKRPRTAGGC